MALQNYIVRVEVGTKTAPGYSFRTDTDTGVYLIGPNNIGISAGDTKIFDATTTLVTIPVALTVSGALTGTLTGNADTATALATPRAINGVNFDGTAAITVTAAAGTLTGTTLAATVTGSSLTSLGTIASLVATTADINAGTFDGVVGGTTPAAGAFTTGAFSGDLSVATSKFTVAAATGNTVVAGTLDVTGASTFSDLITITRDTNDTLILNKSTGPDIVFNKTAATAQSWAIAGEGAGFKIYDVTDAYVAALSIASGTQAVTLSSLAGVGTRAVVADANGVLSAP